MTPYYDASGLIMARGTLLCVVGPCYGAWDLQNKPRFETYQPSMVDRFQTSAYFEVPTFLHFLQLFVTF